MKKITLLLILTFGFVNAQIVTIPDANFKAELLNASANNMTAQDANENFITIDTNADGEIQESEALTVFSLDVDDSNISNMLGIEAFTNLLYLKCSNNQLTSINVTQNINLENLNCNWNQLTSLNVTQNINLSVLVFIFNQISNIDVTNNVNLTGLSCFNNQLTSLDISQNVVLEDLFCYNNQLTSLDTSQNSNLRVVNCYQNQIVSLDLSANLLLNILGCQGNLLETLDVSQNMFLSTIQCQNNQLETVIMKNGGTAAFLNFSNNPDLMFICADEDEIEYVQSFVENTTVVSSYCSFVPGGAYNTISGNLIFDTNNNGCDMNDEFPSNIRVEINDGTSQGAVFTNNNGSYTFFTDSGNFNITPNWENISLFNFVPSTANVPFTDNNNNVFIQDFCVSANGVFNDVEIVIVPIEAAQPGFDAIYQIVYKNKGNQMLSGTLEFSFDGAVLDFISATIVPDNQTTDNLAWDYSNLLPFETRSIELTLNVNSPMETPAINNGDLLSFNASINPSEDDETPLDNSFDLTQTVVGSYDPNDITCLEGDIVNPENIGEYLHYNINFENTGTAAATFIVVKDVIDETQFDVNSLQIMYSSHSMMTRIIDNKVEFIFDNINLQAEGKGNVVFKIKSNNTLMTGDAVNNKAEIFFDYNFPIETNTATTVFDVLSVDEFSVETINIYPNPTEDIVNVNAKSIIKRIEIYDVQGRLIELQKPNRDKVVLEISNLKTGIYFLKIRTINGEGLKKIIKN